MTDSLRRCFACLVIAALAACDGTESRSETTTDIGLDAATSDADVSGDIASDGTDSEDVSPEDVADAADAPPDVEEPPGVAQTFAASSGFRARQAEYLELCAASNGPGEGSLPGQACRVATGQETFNDETIESGIQRMEDRLDTADFRAASLVRLLYLDDETGSLGEARRERISRTLLEFKYWLDEPGDDGMAYWTENHQILFHSAELLMGQRYPDTVFPNSGMTGAEHVAHALPRLERWLDLRGRYGFSEWHSNVYFNEDIPALLNLVDFAEDEVVRELATMVLDVIALDLLHNTFNGVLATTHGRTYQSKFVNGANDSTGEFSWITLGLGEIGSAGNFSAAFLATSEYFPPPLLENLAEAVADRSESRQRDSWNTAEGPDIGVSYEGVDDVVVWAGLSAIVAPEIIDGAMDVMDEYELWDGFLFGSLPREVLDLLRSLMGTPALRSLAEDLGPLSQGMALEAVDTYVFRTPHYQLAGAQDYKPGLWSAQTLMWRGALTDRAFVLTTSPGLVGIADVDDVTVDDPWIGGWQPRVTLHRNVGIIQYRELDAAPLLQEFVQGDYCHVYWPAAEFDEVEARGGWIFGRAGDGFVALWSQHPMEPVEDVDYELRIETRTNVFVVEMGSAEEYGSFADFVDAVGSASPTVADEIVQYSSPILGAVEAGWEGPMTVAGEVVDIGPYDRWDHPSTQQTRHTPVLDVTLGEFILRWDFEQATRTLFVLE